MGNEPSVCFRCLGSGHDARNCPLSIRQKRQRSKVHRQRKQNSRFSYHYRNDCESTSTDIEERQARKKEDAMKQKKEKMQNEWRTETRRLIELYQRTKREMNKD